MTTATKDGIDEEAKRRGFFSLYEVTEMLSLERVVEDLKVGELLEMKMQDVEQHHVHPYIMAWMNLYAQVAEYLRPDRQAYWKARFEKARDGRFDEVGTRREEVPYLG